MPRPRTILSLTGAGLLIALGLGYAVVVHTVRTGVAGVGVALGAQIGCADVYLMGRSVEEAERDDLHALSPAAHAIRLKLDPSAPGVKGFIPGVLSREAVYRPGAGCTLRSGGAELGPAPLSSPPRPPTTPWPRGDADARGPEAPGVSGAVTRLFEETNAGGRLDTRSVLVIQNGKILAERYAPGFTAATPLLGWSMTKSLTSALVGVLVRDGRLSLDAPAPVAAWRSKGDPRGRITLRQLLTMSSGLHFIEDYVAGSNSSQMLFHEGDMAAYAASLPLDHPPGTVWSYSSGTANIVARIVRDAVGGHEGDFDRFAQQQLFAPLGMSSALIEPDQSGTPVGSSYGYATARDWGRFGLLYLNGGVVEGRRILPESWIDFTRAPTPAAPSALYGAMFWLNQGPPAGPRARSYAHCPEDMYLADGHNGQFVAVVPSKNAVIVRLGWTPEAKAFAVDRYFSAIIAALPDKQGDLDSPRRGVGRPPGSGEDAKPVSAAG